MCSSIIPSFKQMNYDPSMDVNNPEQYVPKIYKVVLKPVFQTENRTERVWVDEKADLPLPVTMGVARTESADDVRKKAFIRTAGLIVAIVCTAASFHVLSSAGF